MRISDWSSDVCSSDLLGLLGGQRGHVERIGDRTARQVGRHLLGDLQRHLLLRLRRRGAEVRCGDDRVEPEPPVLLGRLDGEDVEPRAADKSGRASWRERVCQYETIPWDAGSINK